MSLLAPAFLAGIAAIALPIWLHRLSAENPNRQRFTSLMFLEAGEPRRVLAKRLQYLLLLALRIGALVVLALAFAQPAWLHPPRAAGGKAAKLHILVMDTSESMSYGDRWQRAERAARDVLASLGSADRVELVAAGRTPVIVTQPTDDPAAVRRALTTLKPGVFHVDYGRLMRSLDGVLTGVNRPVVLDIVTDAQKSAMPPRFAELAPRRPAELAIHDVADQTPPENWALESFTGSPVTGDLAATVRSFAKTSATKNLVIELNGRRVVERSITVKPGGSVDVKLDPLDLDSGGNRVAALLEPGDGLSLDDRRFLALKRPEPRNVLVVSGNGGNGREDVFVDAALKTLTSLAIKPQTVAPARLGDAELDGASFVVVTDAGALAQADVDKLKTYVQSGGAVLLALGRDASTLAAIPMTGEQVRSMGALSGEGGYLSIGSADLSHPAVQGLDELRSAKFFRYVALTPAPQDHVLVELENGAPLLIERQLGSGRVLLFTSTLNRDWNDLPVQPVFVPFVAGLANELLGSAGFSNQAELGSMLSVQSMGLAAGQIFDPEGRKALSLGAGTTNVLVDQVGFYEAQGGGRSELVAVNPDAAESDLTPVDAATLERWRALGVKSGAAPEPAQGQPGQEARVPFSLGPWLLGFLLVVLVMESWLGNWHLRVRRGIATPT